MDDDFLQDLFIDLSDPTRRQIISTLHNTNSKQQTDLKEILDVNDQELGRNLKRLEERNLIEVIGIVAALGIMKIEKVEMKFPYQSLGNGYILNYLQ